MTITMSAPATELYPAPPPTSNALTHQQRNQLLRKTRKLAYVLGAHPRLFDDVYDSVYLDIPMDGRASVTSSTSGRYRNSVLSSTLRRSSSEASSRSSTSSIRKIKSSDLDYYNDKIPTLRLSSSRPSIRIRNDSDTSSSDSEDSESRFSISPSSDTTPCDSVILPPSFVIPSANTLRRQKMDRLRRKLGDGIPFDLVFRGEWAERPNVLASNQPQPLSPIKETVIEESQRLKADEAEQPQTSISFASPPPRATPRTITSARDSILLTGSPHRAQRIRRKPVPPLIATRPAPPPPALPVSRNSPPLVPVDEKQRRLSLIAESPDESNVTVEVQLFTTVASAMTCLGPRSSYSDSDRESGYTTDRDSPRFQKKSSALLKPPPSPSDGYESSDSEMYQDWWKEYTKVYH